MDIRYALSLMQWRWKLRGTGLVTNALSKYRYAWRCRLAHWRRCWRYLRGTLTQDDALWIMGDCERASGVHGLEFLSTEDVLNSARELWGEHPELERLAGDAVARVAQKWSSTGDVQGAAQDWAIDKIKEYAAADGIQLRELEEAA